MSHGNAALTPRQRLRLARQVVDNGWSISAAADYFRVSYPTDPSDDAEVAACLPGQVNVTPVTDSNNYPVGATPLLSFTLLNTGAAPCSMPAGSDVQEYLIVSGSDRIWASNDCQGEPEPFTAVLEPGVEVASEGDRPFILS